MKNNKTLPLIYILGMPVSFLIANLIANMHIEILGTPLYFSVILYSITFLFSGLIIRKTDHKKALLIMSVSLITSTLAFVLYWALFDVMNEYLMIYAFLSFLICQLIFIYTYDFLVKIKKDSYAFVFILIFIVSIIDNAFFGVIVEGQYISLSILIRLIYVAVLPAILAKK